MINPLQALIARAQGAAGPQQQAPPPAPGAEDDGTQGVKPLIARMIQLGTQAAQLERDPIERAALAKIVATLHDFEAREQKQRDSAMGAGPAVQLLRRTQG